MNKLKTGGGTGNVVKDLLCSTSVFVERLDFDKIKTLKFKQRSEENEISQNSVLIVIVPPSCWICSVEEQIHPFTSKEMDILQEFVLFQRELSSFLDKNICSLCSETLEKLVKLKEKIEHISTTLRSVIRIKHQMNNNYKKGMKLKSYI
jgi:hypothetical protein